MPPLLILDGYTLDGKLSAKGPWPSLSFRYRPALAEEVYEYLRQRETALGKAGIKPVVELLLKHIISWDVQDASENIAAITAENLRRLPTGILSGLVDHVMGYGEAEISDAKN